MSMAHRANRNRLLLQSGRNIGWTSRYQILYFDVDTISLTIDLFFCNIKTALNEFVLKRGIKKSSSQEFSKNLLAKGKTLRICIMLFYGEREGRF